MSLGELSKFSTQLDEPTKRMSYYFPDQPSQDDLHIIVQKPSFGECFLLDPAAFGSLTCLFPI